jgi:hypothetical protein
VNPLVGGSKHEVPGQDLVGYPTTADNPESLHAFCVGLGYGEHLGVQVLPTDHPSIADVLLSKERLVRIPLEVHPHD